MTPIDSKAAIGERAQLIRKEKGYGSMRDVAKLIGISRNDISEIERGIFTGSIDNILKYLNFLGLTLVVQTKSMPTLDELEGLFEDE